MKRYFLIFIISFMSCVAHSQEADINTQVVESTLPEAVVEADDTTLLVITMRDGTEYILYMPPHARAAYTVMTPDQRYTFLRRRAFILRQIARVLHYESKLIFGVGTLIKNKLYQLGFKRKNNTHPLEKLAQSDSSNLTAREKTKLATATALAGVNDQLWTSSLVVINSTEFGFGIAMSGGVGAGILGAQNSKYVLDGFGATFGVNIKTGAIVFDVFNEPERAEQIHTVAFPTAGARFTLYMSKRDLSTAQEVLKGRTYYPAAPLDLKTTSEDLYIGIYLPSPEMAMSLSARLQRYHLMTTSLSLTRGQYFTFHSKLMDFLSFTKTKTVELFDYSRETFDSLSQKIKTYVLSRSVRSCSILW